MSRSYSVFENVLLCVFFPFTDMLFFMLFWARKEEIAVYLWKNNNETKILWIKKLLVQ